MSEVARIKQQIEQEAELFRLVMYGGLQLGTARHSFITRRMEAMSGHMEELSKEIGEEKAIEFITQEIGKPQEEPITLKRMRELEHFTLNGVLHECGVPTPFTWKALQNQPIPKEHAETLEKWAKNRGYLISVPVEEENNQQDANNDQNT